MFGDDKLTSKQPQRATVTKLFATNVIGLWAGQLQCAHIYNNTASVGTLAALIARYAFEWPFDSNISHSPLGVVYVHINYTYIYK